MDLHLPTPNDLPEKQISPVLSPALNGLLRSENEGACQLILRDPELVAEATAQVPVLRAAATQKAGVRGVQEVVGKRFALYPQPDRSEGEWDAWWSDYLDALADVPWAALEAGMAAWVKDPASEFLPKPGKLRELALAAPNWQAKAYERARYVADYRPAPVYDETFEIEPPKVKSIDDAIAIKRMAEEYEAQHRRRVQERSQVVMPSTAGKPDEGGLTPRMRELLARQRGDA